MTQATLDDFDADESTEVMTDGGRDDDTFDADAETVTDAWEGAFIYTSFGYNQTDAFFARIVDVSGSGKTVVAKPARPETTDRSKGSESLRPTAETYGDEFRLHVRNSGGDPAFRGSYPYIDGTESTGTRRDSFLPFSNTAGASVHQTAPGYGH